MWAEWIGQQAEWRSLHRNEAVMKVKSSQVNRCYWLVLLQIIVPRYACGVRWLQTKYNIHIWTECELKSVILYIISIEMKEASFLCNLSPRFMHTEIVSSYGYLHLYAVWEPLVRSACSLSHLHRGLIWLSVRQEWKEDGVMQRVPGACIQGLLSLIFNWYFPQNNAWRKKKSPWHWSAFMDTA